MKTSLIIILLALPTLLQAQEKDVEVNSIPEVRLDANSVYAYGSGLKLQFFRYKEPEMYQGELIWSYLMPELPVYPPIKFKNEKQRAKYNKLIQNVKRTLPIAQRVRSMIGETYGMLEMLPDEKSKSAHISAVEKSIKEQFTPEMKKLTYSQGKLLIKLVDRECKQSSYEIVKAFFGPTKAAFYQMFAWTFRSSLKKEYRPDDDDKLVERVVRQIETGQL